MPPHRRALSDGTVLLVRSGSLDDAPAILEYVEAISRETDFLSFGPGEFGCTLAQERAIIRDYEAADNRLLLVGIVGGSIVGMLTFGGGPRPRNRHTGEFGISVRRAYWGRGVASALLDILLDWARASDVITKVNLRVRTDNARAIALYERKGFVVEGTLSRELRIGDRYYDHYVMGLAI
jgi:RimJ/RimL family protein N-acetyltransferase